MNQSTSNISQLLICLVLIFGSMSQGSASANSDKSYNGDVANLIVGKTMHLKNPRAKIYFSSASTATLYLLSGEKYGASEEIYWSSVGDDKYCFTAAIFAQLESCYGFERLESGNYRISVSRGDFQSVYHLLKKQLLDGIDF